MLEIVIGALLAAILWALVQIWIRAHKWRTERLRFHRDQFFAHADEVLKNGGADDAMLLRLKDMTLDIDDPRQIGFLWRVVIEFDQEVRAGKNKPSGKQPPEEWSATVFNYFLAISYLRGIRGLFLRAALAQVLGPPVGGQNTEIIDRRAHSMRFQPA